MLLIVFQFCKPLPFIDNFFLWKTSQNYYYFLNGKIFFEFFCGDILFKIFNEQKIAELYSLNS